MSRHYLVPIILIVLFGQMLVHSKTLECEQPNCRPATMAATKRAYEQENHREQQRQLQSANIDLTELTPNMEQQLDQAKRLLSVESADDRMPLQDIYRYNLIASPAASGASAASQTTGDFSLASLNQGNWFDRLGQSVALKRKSYNGNPMSIGSNSLSNNLRFSRDLPSYYPASSSSIGDGEAAAVGPVPISFGLGGDQKEDTAYDYVSSEPTSATIDNHEGATRDSLWTSRQLRDLLIAQEQRNRVRQQLARAALAARQKAAKMNRVKMNRNDGGDGPNGIEVMATREKKRRCKSDPNLGVKNPSFCDTDAYFGAADYSMRDVWDSAGR